MQTVSIDSLISIFQFCSSFDILHLRRCNRNCHKASNCSSSWKTQIIHVDFILEHLASVDSTREQVLSSFSLASKVYLELKLGWESLIDILTNTCTKVEAIQLDCQSQFQEFFNVCIVCFPLLCSFIGNVLSIQYKSNKLIYLQSRTHPSNLIDDLGTSFPNLQHLILNRGQKIKNFELQQLTKTLPNLIDLDIGIVDITQETFQIVGQNCIHLQEFGIDCETFRIEDEKFQLYKVVKELSKLIFYEKESNRLEVLNICMTYFKSN
jgi:hypothetical protein